MHHLYFIIHKPEDTAIEVLSSEWFFQNEDLFFAPARSDWWVVGGRWEESFKERTKATTCSIPFTEENKNAICGTDWGGVVSYQSIDREEMPLLEIPADASLVITQIDYHE